MFIEMKKRGLKGGSKDINLVHQRQTKKCLRDKLPDQLKLPFVRC